MRASIRTRPPASVRKLAGIGARFWLRLRLTVCLCLCFALSLSILDSDSDSDSDSVLCSILSFLPCSFACSLARARALSHCRYCCRCNRSGRFSKESQEDQRRPRTRKTLQNDIPRSSAPRAGRGRPLRSAKPPELCVTSCSLCRVPVPSHLRPRVEVCLGTAYFCSLHGRSFQTARKMAFTRKKVRECKKQNKLSKKKEAEEPGAGHHVGQRSLSAGYYGRCRFAVSSSYKLTFSHAQFF